MNEANHDQALSALDDATAQMIKGIRQNREFISDEALLTDDTILYLLSIVKDDEPDMGILKLASGLARALVLLANTDVFLETD